MRLIVLLLMAVLLVGCGKHPVGAWKPVPPEVTPEIIPPPPDARFPRMIFPHHAKDASGRNAEPITLIVAADEVQLASAFEKAGWMAAEAVTPESIEKLRIAQAWSDSYPSAPVAPLFYWGREQDAAWQRPGTSVTNRYRVRVWRSEDRGDNGQWLWALNVAHEDGIGSVPNEGLPLHRVHPDMDRARDVLVQDLAKTGVLRREYLLEGIGPNPGFQTAAGDPYYTGGMIRVLEF